MEPVDVEALKLLDYYEIVTHPMDLGTIKKKWEGKLYINAQEVADDVRLVSVLSWFFLVRIIFFAGL